MPSSNLAAATVVHRLSHEEQLAWIEQVRLICAASPLRSLITPSGEPMSVKVTNAGRLGWTSGPEGYRYTDVDASGNPWPAMPKAWSDAASMVAGEHPWDSAVVNWFGPEARLGRHVDRSEVDLKQPIVTWCFGDACSWVVWDDDDVAHRTRTESGDGTLLAGRNRMRPHSVERIIATPMFSPLRVPGRVSVTIRVAGVRQAG